ncbi:MAG: hypothetical protein V7L25_23750 [Nostoc sp.]|uniref:hypothetical protein n=1 Tax=Nostoc sp. TaxID=1180 RepID=UPI002FEEC919
MKFSRLSVLVGAAAVSTLAAISPAQALSTTFNLNYTLNSGQGSASGQVTIDNSLKGSPGSGKRLMER